MMGKESPDEAGPTMENLNDIERGQFCQSAVECFYSADGSIFQFPQMLQRIWAENLWRRRIVRGKIIELNSFRELITEMPVRGWGLTIDKVAAVIPDPELRGRFLREASSKGAEKANHAAVVEELRGQGATWPQVAEQLGVSLATAKRYGVKKPCRHKKTTPSRKGLRLEIRINAGPETAAFNIREKFGDEFADALGTILISE